MDREEAGKQQVSLLKFFRKEGKNSRGSPRTDSSQTSSSELESSPRSTSPVLHRRISTNSPVVLSPGEGNSRYKTITTNKLSYSTTLSRPVFVCPPSPEREVEEVEEDEEDKVESVTKEEKEVEMAEESTKVENSKMSLKDVKLSRLSDSQDKSSLKYPNYSNQSTKGKEGQSSTTLESPVGGLSTKTLISNMKRALNSSDTDEDVRDVSSDGVNHHQGSSDLFDKDQVKIDDENGDSTLEEGSRKKSYSKPGNSLKRMLSSSDVDQDSQESPVIRVKAVKRARIVASSDEENDDDEGKDNNQSSNTDKEQVNGHSKNTSEDDDMPDGATVDKYLEMWDVVYTFVPKMEALDVFQANRWDVKNTMIELGKLDKQYKAQQKQQKEDAEKARKKEAAKKREGQRKFKLAEREQEIFARKSLKEKVKAQKEFLKAKAALKPMEADLEEEEEDYKFGGANVYNSDVDEEGEEEIEENPQLEGDRSLVLQFFNDASLTEMAAIGGCTKKRAEVILQVRPFADWQDIVHKFKTEKYISPDMLNAAKTVLHVRSTVQQLMKKCENIAKDMQYILSNIVNGVEDAGISKQPDSLNPSMQLKGYQLIGLNWLVLMHQQGLNGVLADEMGLGKTVQAISFLAHIKEVEDPEIFSLIIVPSSTLDNWGRELELWCPDLEVLHYHGSQDERRSIRAEIMNDTLEETDVILTTYNMVTSSTEDRALFKRLKFHTVILDEAHMLKNMASQRYEQLMKVKAQRRLLLTGTPLQNNLVELMSILIFVMPRLFDSKKEELKRVFSMFPKSESGTNKGRFERERIEQAKRIMKPFFLRRLKCEVLKDLPTKSDEVIHAPMSERQNKVYKGTVSSFSKRARQHQVELEELNLKQLSELEELEATCGSPKKKETQKDASSNMVMTLRKIANHPLLTREYYTEKKLREISKVLKKTSHRDSVLEYIVEDFSVMSDFEIHSTCHQYPAVRKYCLQQELLLSSGKLQQLDILLPKLKEEGARVLIFSQFVIVLNILEKYVQIRGHNYLRFDGSTQVSERQELIDQFTDDDDIFLFLLSTRAGGLGVNLTAANTVILHDIDFNPYNDKQAEDRCHRVGQTRAVKIIRLVSKGTIEEGMLQIAQDKLQLERDVTGMEEGAHKKGDVLSLLKDALGLGTSNPGPSSDPTPPPDNTSKETDGRS
ncbi:hypothetical protein Pcinc_039143 [Petrolisthes cinctipes]|uniref:SWI/SNF-related matrix-associated actin-dependent regulator of chromatin subfamily A containing DEAD/H box 1 homolog n=1 Tax=Petrolisthes cinctipes TaxID=88211 RepID=A0AAE1BPF6_PETCI|nr:hypothetical protein Pcinc_039143 [Petrolisthes cinctipes]